MSNLLLNLLLAVSWMALTGEITIYNFIEGLFIGFILIWISRHAIDSKKYLTKIPKIIEFIFFFLWELILANLRVTYDILTPKDLMKPAIVAVELEIMSDFEVTLLENIITLTQGTLRLDISEDKKKIYIHSMYVDDIERFKSEIKNNFERRILEVFR